MSRGAQLLRGREGGGGPGEHVYEEVASECTCGGEGGAGARVCV